MGAAAARALNQAEEAYAFFNNNNQTNGVAQAPAGAQLLRRLLEEEQVPVRMMRVLAVTHGPLVRPELFGDVVVEAGHEVAGGRSRTRRPPLDGYDAVLVFGGEQNVGEEVSIRGCTRSTTRCAAGSTRHAAARRLSRRADARARARRAVGGSRAAGSRASTRRS